MLLMNQATLEALRRERVEAFARHLAARARRLHPEAAAGLADDGLVAAMTGAIEAARARGLKTRSLMERFSDLSMVLGFGFETARDWAQASFADESRSPAERLRAVEASAVFVVREG